MYFSALSKLIFITQKDIHKLRLIENIRYDILQQSYLKTKNYYIFLRIIIHLIILQM